MGQLYLHDKPVTYVGTGAFGTFVMDRAGHRHCVFTKGIRVRDCLDSHPRPLTTWDCPNCDWTRAYVHECGGSCDMFVSIACAPGGRLGGLPKRPAGSTVPKSVV